MNNHAGKPTSSISSYIAIARVDHWFKQVFCIPGVVLALVLEGTPFTAYTLVVLVKTFFAVSITASSNYVINEILDAPSDLAHPDKRHRPIPSGKVNVKVAYLEWLALGAIGLGLAWTINFPFFVTAAWLWVMGIIYNVPPIRGKEVAVIDVLCESINNPIRLLMGWYAMGAQRVAPLSLICAYWMLGAFLMTAKRFAEYRHIADRQAAAAYRGSFKWYTENRLAALMVFYANCCSLFVGIFFIKYRVELILTIPFVAGLIATYWHLSYRPNSPVQVPEKLYREKRLMVVCFLLAIVSTAMVFIDLPFLAQFFEVRSP